MRWTPREDDILRRNFRDGKGIDACVSRLRRNRRSGNAIYQRAQKISLVGVTMSKTTIILKMHNKPDGHVFRSRELGGNIEQLRAMEKAMLISSNDKGWFLSDRQHTAMSFLFD